MLSVSHRLLCCRHTSGSLVCDSHGWHLTSRPVLWLFTSFCSHRPHETSTCVTSPSLFVHSFLAATFEFCHPVPPQPHPSSRDDCGMDSSLAGASSANHPTAPRSVPSPPAALSRSLCVPPALLPPPIPGLNPNRITERYSRIAPIEAQRHSPTNPQHIHHSTKDTC